MVREHTSMPAVICVAAHAGLLLAQKYHLMNDECEVYRIAIGNNYSYLCALIQYPYNFCSHVSRQEVAMVCRPQLESGSHRRGKAAGNRSVDNVKPTANVAIPPVIVANALVIVSLLQFLQVIY